MFTSAVSMTAHCCHRAISHPQHVIRESTQAAISKYISGSCGRGPAASINQTEYDSVPTCLSKCVSCSAGGDVTAYGKFRRGCLAGASQSVPPTSLLTMPTTREQCFGLTVIMTSSSCCLQTTAAWLQFIIKVGRLPQVPCKYRVLRISRVVVYVSRRRNGRRYRSNRHNVLFWLK